MFSSSISHVYVSDLFFLNMRNQTVLIYRFLSWIDLFLIFVNQLKERAEKLENWRMKVKMHEDKKAEKNELLNRQSSMWIDEGNLEKKVVESMVEIMHL